MKLQKCGSDSNRKKYLSMFVKSLKDFLHVSVQYFPKLNGCTGCSVSRCNFWIGYFRYLGRCYSAKFVLKLTSDKWHLIIQTEVSCTYCHYWKIPYQVLFVKLTNFGKLSCNFPFFWLRKLIMAIFSKTLLLFKF